MSSQYITSLIECLPEFPISKREHPSGGVGLLCDDDAEIVLTETREHGMQVLVATFAHYSPEGVAIREEGFGRFPCTLSPYFTACNLRGRFRAALRREEAAMREHCAAARKASQR